MQHGKLFLLYSDSLKFQLILFVAYRRFDDEVDDEPEDRMIDTFIWPDDPSYLMPSVNNKGNKGWYGQKRNSLGSSLNSPPT